MYNDRRVLSSTLKTNIIFNSGSKSCQSVVCQKNNSHLRVSNNTRFYKKKLCEIDKLLTTTREHIQICDLEK